MNERINKEGLQATVSEIQEQNDTLASLRDAADAAIGVMQNNDRDERFGKYMNTLYALSINMPVLNEVATASGYENPNFTIAEVGHLGMHELDKLVIDLERDGYHDMSNSIRKANQAQFVNGVL